MLAAIVALMFAPLESLAIALISFAVMVICSCIVWYRSWHRPYRWLGIVSSIVLFVSALLLLSAWLEFQYLNGIFAR